MLEVIVFAGVDVVESVIDDDVGIAASLSCLGTDKLQKEEAGNDASSEAELGNCLAKEEMDDRPESVVEALGVGDPLPGNIVGSLERWVEISNLLDIS